jgi:hypothetical protein
MCEKCGVYTRDEQIGDVSCKYRVYLTMQNGKEKFIAWENLCPTDCVVTRDYNILLIL